MAQRSESDGSVSIYKGRYHRTLGKILNSHGKLIAKKFLLGTDSRAAEIANRLLEQLWHEVVLDHQGAERLIRHMGGRLGDINQLTGVIDYQRLRRVDYGPIWRDESAAIAEAIRRGKREMIVELGDDTDCPAKYVERIADLRARYSVIAFMPESSQLYATGQKELAGCAQQIIDDAQQEVQKISSRARAPLPVANGQTLYQALQAYAEFAVKKNQKAFGPCEAGCAPVDGFARRYPAIAVWDIRDGEHRHVLGKSTMCEEHWEADCIGNGD